MPADTLNVGLLSMPVWPPFLPPCCCPQSKSQKQGHLSDTNSTLLIRERKLTPHSTLDTRKIVKQKPKPKEMQNIRRVRTMRKKKKKESFTWGNVALMDITDFWQGKPRRASWQSFWPFTHLFIHSINIFAGFKILRSVLWWLLVHTNRK